MNTVEIKAGKANLKEGDVLVGFELRVGEVIAISD